MAIEIAAGAARRGHVEVGEPGARGNKPRCALAFWLTLAFLLRECAEPPNAGVAGVLQEVVILVDQPPERLVEDLPARGIRRGRRPPREVQELARYPHGAG